MNYTIEDINNPIGNGYAFMDECGHCIIIVYGEKLKKDMITHLNK